MHWFEVNYQGKRTGGCRVFGKSFLMDQHAFLFTTRGHCIKDHLHDNGNATFSC